MSTHASSLPIDLPACWQAVQAAAQPANPRPPDLRRHPTDDEWFTDDDGETCRRRTEAAKRTKPENVFNTVDAVPPAAARSSNNRLNGCIDAFVVAFASHLKREHINSVVPQPFVADLAKRVKKDAQLPGMMRQVDCARCRKVFFLDGWQADSDKCRGCRGVAFDSSVEMPTAFIHRAHGEFTSVVSASIGRKAFHVECSV
jgi:hypothetical protein